MEKTIRIATSSSNLNPSVPLAAPRLYDRLIMFHISIFELGIQHLNTHLYKNVWAMCLKEKMQTVLENWKADH